MVSSRVRSSKRSAGASGIEILRRRGEKLGFFLAFLGISLGRPGNSSLLNLNSLGIGRLRSLLASSFDGLYRLLHSIGSRREQGGYTGRF